MRKPQSQRISRQDSIRHADPNCFPKRRRLVGVRDPQHRIVRRFRKQLAAEVCQVTRHFGSMPFSSTHLKGGTKSVPPPPLGDNLIASEGLNSSTACTAASQ